jgi:hypothetical protein
MNKIDRSYPKRESKDFAQRPFVMFDAALLGWLQPLELVTYLQIKRRAGLNGDCWESITHMAEETAMSPSSIKRSIRSLLQKNLIAKTKRKGGTDLYVMTPPEEWRFEKLVEQITEHGSVRPEHGSVRPTEHGSVRPTNKIPIKLDPPNTLTSLKISNAGEGTTNKTGEVKSAYAENLKSSLKPSTSINAPEGAYKSSDEGIHQQAREEGIQSILEPVQEINNLSLESNYQTNNLETSTNLESLREDKGAAARTTKLDKTKDINGKERPIERQKAIAKKLSTAGLIEAGISNNRWSNRDGYERFEAYAIEHCRQVNDGRKIGFEKIDDPDKYVPAMLRRVSNCSDDNSVDLSIWKAWVSEVPAPPLIEVKPFEVTETSPEIIAIFEAFKANAAIERAAREAAAQAKADRLREAWGDVA